MSVDLREQYKYEPWDYGRVFVNRNGNKVAITESQKLMTRQATIYIEGRGNIIIFTFGSEQECAEAVREHNRNYKLEKLLMGK